MILYYSRNRSLPLGKMGARPATSARADCTRSWPPARTPARCCTSACIAADWQFSIGVRLQPSVRVAIEQIPESASEPSASIAAELGALAFKQDLRGLDRGRR